MNCTIIQDNFSAFYDDCLDQKEKADFELHISKCDKCKKEYSVFKNAMIALASLPGHQAPDDIIEIVNHRIDLDMRKHGSLKRFFSNPLVSAIPQMATIVLFLVLGFMMFQAYNKFQQLGRTKSPYQDSTVKIADQTSLAQAISKSKVEVVPVSKKAGRINTKIEKLVVLSRGKVIRPQRPQEQKENEMLITVPQNEYLSFMDQLKKAIEEEEGGNPPALQPKSTIAPDLSAQSKEAPSTATPIPEVMLIKVVFQ